MYLCQIAISATDLLRTHQWYRRALGFVAAGALRHREVAGPGKVSDLPESALDVWCLVDRQDFFQFELFEFQRPRMRTIPGDWRASDFGYVMIGLHVADFDAALNRLLQTSGRPLGAPIGSKGRRRVCLRDPEGVLLELMEDDLRSGDSRARPRPEVPTVTRSISLSVPNLDRARRFWVEAIGASEAGAVALHGPEHDALWGLPGASRRSLLLWAGDFLIELVEYLEPRGRQRPAGYLLSDQGILNVAFGTLDKEDFDIVYDRVISLGYRANSEPWTLKDVATVVYLNDDQGFSVELLHVQPSALDYMGFTPAPDVR